MTFMLSWFSCLICCMVMYYIKTAFSTKGSVLQPQANQEKESMGEVKCIFSFNS